MIPVPFACNPGDKLRVTEAVDTYTPHLAPGDLVTVIEAGVWVEQGRTIPVVRVSTSHGPQTLGFDAVEPYTPPTYTPAEPDEIIDAQLRALVASDPELGTWATDADTALGAVEPQVSDQLGGGTVTTEEQTTAGANRRIVGETYALLDADGDELEVTYYEQDCDHHGREGIFMLTINDEAAVVIPVSEIDHLLRYLITRKKHSERPQD